MKRKNFKLVLTLLILAGIFSSAYSQKDSTSAIGWRNSWKKFAEAVVDYKNHAPKFPQCGRNSLLEGGELTPPNWPVMKKFNGAVIFEGTLMQLINNSDSTKLMKGQPFNLDFKMIEEGPPGIAKPLYIYPKKSTIQKWKSITVGSKVKFKSKISGICGICYGSKCLYVVLLTEAEPLEEK